jgi:hypothetical protein
MLEGDTVKKKLLRSPYWNHTKSAIFYEFDTAKIDYFPLLGMKHFLVVVVKYLSGGGLISF